MAAVSGERRMAVWTGRRTWNLVSSVLHTPVNSIIATRNGTTALTAMVEVSERRGTIAPYRVVENTASGKDQQRNWSYARVGDDWNLERWKEEREAAHTVAGVVDLDAAGIAWLVTEGARTASHGDTIRYVPRTH
jgi:hypothetical protein